MLIIIYSFIQNKIMRKHISVKDNIQICIASKLSFLLIVLLS